MDNIIKEGEQFVENQGGNQTNEQGSGQNDLQDTQQNQQTQQRPSEQQGGGMMKNFEQNAGDAYVNQGTSGPLNMALSGQANPRVEVNGFLNKEGVPSGMDGAIDGAVDTEANNLEKDF